MLIQGRANHHGYRHSGCDGVLPALIMTESGDDQQIVMLDAVGSMLSAKRTEAVSGRLSSGIEQMWVEDDEFYAGYDDANRHEFVNAPTKPVESLKEARPTGAGSTVFPNITQPYVDAVSARVGDMMIPSDDRNFAVQPTPIPELARFIPTPVGNTLLLTC